MQPRSCVLRLQRGRRHTDIGSMFAQSGVNVDKVDDAIGAIVTEFRRIAEEPVGADELEKARNYMKGRFVFSIETPQDLIRTRALRRGARRRRRASPRRCWR